MKNEKYYSFIAIHFSFRLHFTKRRLTMISWRIRVENQVTVILDPEIDLLRLKVWNVARCLERRLSSVAINRVAVNRRHRHDFHLQKNLAFVLHAGPVDAISDRPLNTLLERHQSTATVKVGKLFQ